MAIAFAQVSIHSRAKGHSALAASSYRTASKLYDQRTGITYDYSKRGDIVFSEILLPDGSSIEYQDREFLWNQVESAERRGDAQICKDFVLALPKELSTEHHIELTKRFAMTYFVEQGLPVDFAIHDHGDGNPHAHILTTTRRLEHNKFSRYKARDLNPVFAKRFIVEQDYWGERWREYQNNYFIEHQLDLSVDLNHIISERHAGRFRNETEHYKAEENQLIKSARAEIALSNPEVFLQKIMQTHSVFTRRDIERLVFKTFENTQHSNDYLNSVAQTLAHHSVVHLGKNERGIDSYTTQEHYMREGNLLNHVEQLYTRFTHVSNASLDALIQGYQLNEEQTEAMNYIAKGCDINVLIGRPGVGKSYLLKPLKEHYESINYQVIGTSLSGKVAKALQAETGIPSSTIASLIYRLRNNQITLSKKHILVVDEAGMVDVASMEYLLETVNKAGAKIILVGDPDQLKPINKGEIFRGIAARIGYIELEQIKRQRDLKDREASLALAHGQVANAINHYSSKGVIHFGDECGEAANVLITQWQQNKTAESIKEHVILAFKKASVELLNLKARSVLQEQGLIQKEQYEYQSQNGAQKIQLALGERILFRQNHKELGVRNGELATIARINSSELQATLDSGEQVVIPKSYAFIDYGYALTVHKSQGMTIDHASVFVDSPYWDKNLAFVAMTRHRDSLHLYTSKHHHPDLNALIKTLSRSTIKDNVIDWPLDFAMRAGFEPDSLIGKAINSLTKAAHLIKDKWNYIVNYEGYLNTQKLNSQSKQYQQTSMLGHNMAQLLDEAAELRKQFRQVEKEASLGGIKQSEHPRFDALYHQSLERDKRAAQMLNEQKELVSQNDTVATKGLESLKSYADRYARYQSLATLAQMPMDERIPTHLAERVAQIDIQKDRYHLHYLAKTYNKSPELLINRVKHVQQLQREKIWHTLCNDHPVLAQYERLIAQSAKSQGYAGEQHRKQLHETAVVIMANNELVSSLQKVLPKVAKAIHERAVPVKEQERSL